ncbi:MAG: GGDEF domain-containing protein [Candidatus Nealsonbacteria bacterium]
MNKILKGFWLLIRYGPAKIAEWQEQSIYDSLTGLYNRRFLLEVGKRELARADRAKKEGVQYPISLVFIDLRKLKLINDHEGHKAGDESLKTVAVLLRKICQRKVDVVCRISGDEFVILLPDTTISGAERVVEKIQIASQGLSSPGGRLIVLDCGMAEAESSLNELLQKADEAMYQNKKGSKS